MTHTAPGSSCSFGGDPLAGTAYLTQRRIGAGAGQATDHGTHRVGK